MLRDAELASIRETVATWLPQLATITRPDGGQSADGFPDATPSTIGTDVACRVEPASSRGGQERIAASGVVSAAPWNIVFGHDVADIKPQDVVTVTGVGVFEVVAATSDRGVQTDVVAACVKRD